jgi:hypothetical protein
VNAYYLTLEQWVDQEISAVTALNEASVQWNNARYTALLVVPPEIAAQIPKLDRELDRLVESAAHGQWGRDDFRQERIAIGRMAGEYLRLARGLTGLRDIDLPSIWTWDAAQQESVRHGQEPSGGQVAATGPTAEDATIEHPRS